MAKTKKFAPLKERIPAVTEMQRLLAGIEKDCAKISDHIEKFEDVKNDLEALTECHEPVGTFADALSDLSYWTERENMGPEELNEMGELLTNVMAKDVGLKFLKYWADDLECLRLDTEDGYGEEESNVARSFIDDAKKLIIDFQSALNIRYKQFRKDGRRAVKKSA